MILPGLPVDGLENVVTEARQVAAQCTHVTVSAAFYRQPIRFQIRARHVLPQIPGREQNARYTIIAIVQF